jgi:hypothetical protein
MRRTLTSRWADPEEEEKMDDAPEHDKAISPGGEPGTGEGTPHQQEETPKKEILHGEITYPAVREPSADPGGEPPASRRRVEANRKNALRSTGPKSQQGKDVASRNSLRHGLLAKSAVIMRGPVKENKAEFDELLNGLHDYFCPLGTAEELLVQEIAVSYWMERRAQLYENAEIFREAWPVPKPKAEPWEEVGYGKKEPSIYELRDSDEQYMLLRREDGVEYLFDALDFLKGQVEENSNKYYEEPIDLLAGVFGGYWKAISESEEYDSHELLAEIEKEKQKLALLKKKLKEQTRRARRRVPDFSHTALLLAPEKLELVQRYTAAHEKRRYRALAQLERLQRQRTGEVIPPPINVQVSER